MHKAREICISLFKKQEPVHIFYLLNKNQCEQSYTSVITPLKNLK